MNTKTVYRFFAFLLVSLTNTLAAQSSFELGALPALNINLKLKKDWSLNSKVESRLLFQEGQINGDVDKNFNVALIDFSLIAAKKVGLNSRIAGGYMFRIEDGVLHHRFIQQYVAVQRFSNFRLAHRFVSDQTFSEREEPEFRFRYRITAEIPLNGESVDPGEFYIKMNNEYLNSFQSSTYDLEIRLIPLLGYDITDDFRVESGLDYRVDSFLASRTSHSYWMTFNVFLNF